MSYHPDPRTNDIILAVINDGDGTMCGLNYRQRCAAAEFGLAKFRVAAKAYADYSVKVFEQSPATRRQVLDAASCLQEYYRRHMAESA